MDFAVGLVNSVLQNSYYRKTVINPAYQNLFFRLIKMTLGLVFASCSLPERQTYTCQLFLRYKREIFILRVLGFLKTTRSFPQIPKEVWSLPKTSEVCRGRARSQCFSLQKSEIARKPLSFIHFTHGFRSLHGSEWTYFWKLCQARRQQLTFFNQVWEIGPHAWAGVRSKFSTRRRETHA